MAEHACAHVELPLSTQAPKPHLRIALPSDIDPLARLFLHIRMRVCHTYHSRIKINAQAPKHLNDLYRQQQQQQRRRIKINCTKTGILAPSKNPLCRVPPIQQILICALVIQPSRYVPDPTNPIMCTRNRLHNKDANSTIQLQQQNHPPPPRPPPPHA